MSDPYSPVVNHGTTETPTLGDHLAETAKQVNTSIADMRRSMETKFDQGRTAAASGLHQAASSLHESADHLPGADSVSDMAHGAANTLNTTANYVRDNNLRKMMSDVEGVVKNNPGPSLIVAVGIGFLAGRAFWSRD